ncbi:MAG: hypothetical protein KDB32_09880 [Planctomycetes bacterium]|nr:hypothetical protein [Planctomycetota bacterium]MCA8946914.1 hypothetical protein [Planctomycetota bacterium]
MMQLNKGLLVALFAMSAAPLLFAQESMVGQDAPEFKATVCVNQPDETTLAQCAGEVVLIKYWGTN